MVMDILTIAAFVSLVVYKALLKFSPMFGGGIAIYKHKASLRGLGCRKFHLSILDFRRTACFPV